MTQESKEQGGAGRGGEEERALGMAWSGEKGEWPERWNERWRTKQRRRRVGQRGRDQGTRLTAAKNQCNLSGGNARSAHMDLSFSGTLTFKPKPPTGSGFSFNSEFEAVRLGAECTTS